MKQRPISYRGYEPMKWWSGTDFHYTTRTGQHFVLRNCRTEKQEERRIRGASITKWRYDAIELL